VDGYTSPVAFEFVWFSTHVLFIILSRHGNQEARRLGERKTKIKKIPAKEQAEPVMGTI
jgi:hypothetical protein